MARIRLSRDVAIAVAIHAILFLLLLVSIDWSGDKMPGEQGEEEQIVKATVVDDARMKAEEDARRKAAEDKAAAERKRAEAVRRKQEAERKAAAEQKRKAEERKRAEDTARKAAEEKAVAERKRQAEVAQKAAAEKAAAEKAAAEKAAAEKAAAEERRRQEEAARKAAEEKAAEELRKKEEAERKAAEEKALQEQLQAEETQLAARRAEKVRSILDHYRMLIRQKIERNWIRPPSSQGHLSCIVKVRPAPDGGVLSARIANGSGDAAFDRSVVAAVFKASPLPLPDDRSLYDQFRDLEIKFDPED
ncbi:MAG: cell envelope integrity protein TolA [Gammaproteobacteria bacterium]|nr:cell envelope integrity protein TolA [Gammaproteobacteria bacterium]